MGRKEDMDRGSYEFDEGQGTAGWSLGGQRWMEEENQTLILGTGRCCIDLLYIPNLYDHEDDDDDDDELRTFFNKSFCTKMYVIIKKIISIY